LEKGQALKLALFFLSPLKPIVGAGEKVLKA